MTGIKRTFIGIFGRRNQGKSALLNAIAKQDLAIVSAIPGTTTDPVKKSIEILGIGPAVLVDTAGIDDLGSALGQQRVGRSLEAIDSIDAAILVISHNTIEKSDIELITSFKNKKLPFLIVHNKSDEETLSATLRTQLESQGAPVVECSAVPPTGIEKVVEALVTLVPEKEGEGTLLGDLVQRGEWVALVMPQDSEAPAGRLIRPQVQVIRDLLDHHAIPVAMQPEELDGFLKRQTPALVVTDSQVFAQVAPQVPAEVPLTSFSIVLARAKGHFDLFINNTQYIDNLKDNDKILMLESCTHTATCDDIGRHKIPTLLQKKTGKKLQFEFVAALAPLPQNLDNYAFAIQCGGCMVTRRQLWNRVETLKEAGVPVSNYGMTLAYLTGIFDRVTSFFTKQKNSQI